MFALLSSALIVVAPLLLLHGRVAGARGVPQAAHPPRVRLPVLRSQLVGYHGRSAEQSATRAADQPAADPAPPVTTTTVPAPAPATPSDLTSSGPTPSGPTPSGGAPPAAPSSSEGGLATWYPEAPPGDCASPVLPYGTDVEVVDEATGATTSCLVDDREAPNPGRVVDLSYTGFAQIADPTQGVAPVTVSW